MFETAVAIITDLDWVLLTAIVVALASATLVEFGADSLVGRRLGLSGRRSSEKLNS